MIEFLYEQAGTNLFLFRFFMYIKIKVHTNQNKEKLEKVSEDRFECFMKEKAENNAANKKLRELLSEYFGISQGSIKIVKGHHMPNKIILIIS